jgi:hypothetical protein
MPPDPSRRLRRGVLVALVVALGVGACSSSDDRDGAATPAPSPAPTTTDQLFTPATESGADPSGTDAVGEPDDAAVTTSAGTDGAVGSVSEGQASDRTTLATVPDTGVPGIDSTDVFCRAWSRFGGTFQALAVAWDRGEPPLAARNEVAAAGAVLAAIDALDTNVPAELEGERADLAALVAPLGRRAAAGRDELVAAGVDPEGVDALGEAWLDALADAGIDEPSIEIVVPATVDEGALTAAADAFASARPSLLEDPSMITGVAVPETEQYLIDNCPDRGTLLGNDDVAP